MVFDGCLQPRVAIFYAAKVALNEPGCSLISDVNNLAILYSRHLSFGNFHHTAETELSKEDTNENMRVAFKQLTEHLRVECHKFLPDPSARNCGACGKQFSEEQEKYCIKFCWCYNKKERREYEQMKKLPLEWVEMAPCMKCKLVTYCSAECRDEHHEVHKEVCITIPG